MDRESDRGRKKSRKKQQYRCKIIYDLLPLPCHLLYTNGTRIHTHKHTTAHTHAHIRTYKVRVMAWRVEWSTSIPLFSSLFLLYFISLGCRSPDFLLWFVSCDECAACMCAYDAPYITLKHIHYKYKCSILDSKIESSKNRFSDGCFIYFKTILVTRIDDNSVVVI